MIPTEKVQKAIELMKKGGANYEHFFSKLDSSDWIGPLAAQGFFATPPPAIREGGYIRLPFWPESKFLARVANKAPVEVLERFLKIPDTENARIYEDMAEAALAMPMEVAVKLADRLARVATAPYSFSLPEHLTSLALRLCAEGFTQEGMRLLAALLSLQTSEDGSGAYRENSPSPKISVHEFESTTKKLVPELANLVGLEALKLLSRVAKEYFDLSIGDGKNAYDFTWMERPAIEDHQQNWQHGILDPIIEAVRDAALHLRKAASLSEIVSVLEEPGVPILRRVAMHVVAVTEEPPPDLLRTYLVNQENYNSNALHHEYFVLSERHFGKLSIGDQGHVFAWIDAEDDPEEVKKQSAGYGREFTDDEAKSAASYRKLAHLTPVKDHLTGERQAEYERLLARHGPPQHPDFLSYHGEFRVGDVSPIDAEELASMSPDQIVSYLQTWQPVGDSFDAPTMEGLAHRLESCVKANPGPFADAASQFKGLDPTYVRSVLGGIEQTVRDNRKPHWPPLLDLAAWAMDQVDPSGGQATPSRDKDPGWSWTRKQVASLLASGLSGQLVEPDISLRETVWSIIAALANDPDPTPDHEATYGGSNMSPSMLALNTTRGTAIRAVVHYLLWVFRSAPKDEFALAKVPEAEAVLEGHLGVSADPSLAVRSVYGQYAPWLAMMDEHWFVTVRDTIFDQSAGMEEYWHAAWDTYITHCKPFDQMLGLLDSKYRHAIDRTTQTTQDSGPWDATASLGVHILVFYGRKQLDLRQDSLIDYYLERTTPLGRKKGLGELGHDFFHNAANVNPEFSGRFVPVWDLLIERAAQRPPNAREDLAAFGWWFSSGVLPLPWSQQALLRVLELAPSIDLAHAVIERLAEHAPTYPAEALRALELLFEQQSERMDFSYERTEVMLILRQALSSPASEKAADFVHRLGSAGIHLYGKLLSEREEGRLKDRGNL